MIDLNVTRVDADFPVEVGQKYIGSDLEEYTAKACHGEPPYFIVQQGVDDENGICVDANGRVILPDAFSLLGEALEAPIGQMMNTQFRLLRRAT